MSRSPWTVPLLGIDSPIPTDRPFTLEQAKAHGVSPQRLRALLSSGLLIRPLRGVYHAVQLPDTLELRAACLALVVPPDCVVTDRTAGWLLGAEMILAPNDHLAPPQVSMFRPPGYRLRNPLAASGERTFRPDEVIETRGILVTSPVRTASDMGRLLHRDQAFAAMDSMLRTGRLTRDELVAEVPRFRGMRGVRQLRALSPLTDGRSASPGESVLRLRWLDCSSLPRPELQIEVAGPTGRCFLDLGLEGLRYAAEYDGAEWHRTPTQRAHDRRRRTWLRQEGGWLIDALGSVNVFGGRRDVESILHRGIEAARRRIRDRG